MEISGRRELGVALWIAVCCWVLQRNAAQLTPESEDEGSAQLEILPAACVRTPHVILGSPFQWALTDGSAVQNENCSFWEVEGSVAQQTSKEWSLDDSQYTFYMVGNYHFLCDTPASSLSGDFSVVAASHTVALCRNCSGGENVVNIGEVLRWTVADLNARECVVGLRDVKSGKAMEPEGDGYHLFREPGSYEIYCTEDDSISSRIRAVDGTKNSNEEEDEKDRYKALLYIHAGLMGVTFGVLLPLGAFLAHHKILVVHKVTQPIGILLAIAGFVMVIVYIQLNDREHFDELIHGVLGLVLVLLVLLVMPALLVRKTWRRWHKRCGHVIAFFGMGNVLLGLSILPAPHVASLVLCIVYGLWLLGAILVYVVVVPLQNKMEEVGEKPDSRKPWGSQLIELGGKVSLLSTGRRGSGPQALSKNVIQEDKMIELRKKSMDPNEAQRHREELNKELQLQQQKWVEDSKKGSKPPDAECIDSHNKYVESTPNETRRLSLTELDTSRTALLQSQRSSAPEPETPTSPPVFSPQCPLHANHTPKFHILESSGSSDENDSEDEKDVVFRGPSSPPVGGEGTAIHRAHTFNIGHSSVTSESDDFGHSRTGSLRITRHSQRARHKGVEDFYGSRNHTSPVFRVHSPTPCEDPEDFPVVVVETPLGKTAQTATASRDRRRKQTVVVPPLFVPPTITTTLARTSPLPSALKKQSSQDETDNRSPNQRQGISPSPSSGGSDQGQSPQPHKKKVSVAQFEATVVPPSPFTLQPPRPFGGLSHSPSFNNNTLRVEQDIFAGNALRTVMQISQDAIICANNIGEIVFWSVGAVKMFGYTPGEAIGSSLEMIIPMNYKEKHRKGISKRTEDTLKYMRKHSYAPEEQKHARLYAVQGISRNGKEFPVEVNVTSFVIDGEIFYTGVITEMTRYRSTRAGSISSAYSDASGHESSLQQRAMAVGAQMKIAHQLHSAEHITHRELERVLAGSFSAAKFEVPQDQMEQMVNGIMKAGDPAGSGVILFTRLIHLLSKHRLYISESGVIARYGKTKGPQGEMGDQCWTLTDKMKQFFYSQFSSICWFLTYILLTLLLLITGVLATEKEGWAQWAYGTGPVLSMNCVLVLLPTLTSLFHAMRNSRWMNLAFPLTNLLAFHIIIAGGILFWTAIHVLTHFASFAIDSHSHNQTSHTSFKSSFNDHIFPVVTGFIILAVFFSIMFTSIRPIRRLFRFIPFYLIHWVGTGVFYVLLVLHGDNCFNPSFWKWLLPFVVVVILERLHRCFLVEHQRVGVKGAGPYDDTTRVGVLELKKPKGFKFEAGQFVVVNIPWIGYFNWHACYISSGPRDDVLTIYIPKEDDIWFTEVFAQLKSHPYKRHPVPPHADGKTPKPKVNLEEEKEERNGKGEEGEEGEREKEAEEEEEEEMEGRISVDLRGPYGPGHGMIFDYQISAFVCGGNGPHASKALIKKFLEYRKGSSCHCGCHPNLKKLYFVWVIPSGNDFEWFTDYLSDLCEDANIQRYLDIRVFLTNIDSPPDELASALLQLGLKTAGENCNVRRPSQPQLNNLYQMTSYGVPDFNALLDYIQAQHSDLWNEKPTEFGVYSVGDLHYTIHRDLTKACTSHSKPGQLIFKQQHITT